MTKKKVGRPRIYLEPRVRRNLNIQRSDEFDASLMKTRTIIANLRNVPVHSISQTEAVRIAVGFYCLDAKMSADRGETQCPRCNGIGYITIRNGDDDISCKMCNSSETEL